MQIEPEFSQFSADHDAGRPQLVWTRLVADLETPVSAMLKLGHGRSNAFLLESVEGGAVRGRYSILGLNPDIIWRAHGDKAEINRNALQDPDRFEPCPLPALDSIRALLADSRIDLPETLPPMSAGVFGYLGYDSVRLMEHLPDENPDALGLPDSILLRPTVMAIFDNVKDELTLVTPVRPRQGVKAKAAFVQAIERIEQVVGDLSRPIALGAESEDPFVRAENPVSNTGHDDYLAMVERAKDYITAGDIFQVVLSQRFETPFALPAFSLYRALRRVNPSPYLYYLNFDGFSVVGSSPEILVRVKDGRVTVRPIAGTRPRGRTRAEDEALGAELLADPKERAEHLMLLDLGRNDVGRVSTIGSVKVTDQFFLEHYSQVMHIVSNVEGLLDDSHDAVSALAAGFPAGTVSGAPKVRAMQIIDELEKDKRGIYAGCVGYFSANGDMDTCIVLRTAIVKDGVMHVQAGAGIVADSVPESEYAECVNKAGALFRAAEEAARFAGEPGRGQ
ncbi:MAG: anthranilate synthase component I [Hyphomicrobiales bacterium]|nr:MAG: anthranilate synthase component I [Hyphomicrobiales bacterium]